MNDLVRPTSYLTRGIAASAPGGVLATIPNPSPEIARLPAGTTLRGVVIGTDDRGHVLVKTDQGTLAVTTKTNLAKNTEVVLQIRSSGTQLHIMIMQTRTQGVAPGAPPQSSARTPALPPGPGGAGPSQTQPGSSGNLSAPAPSPGPPGAVVTSPGPADPLNLGQVVRALVQGPAGPTPASPAGGPPASVAQQPGAQSAAAGNSTLAGAQAGQLPRPAPGTVVPLRILSVSAPGPAPSVPVTPVPGPAVSSTQGARAYAPSGPQGPPGTSSPAATVPSFGGSANTAPGTPSAVGTPGTPGTPAAPSLAAPNPAAPPTTAPFNSPGAVSDTSTMPLRFIGLVTSVTNAGHPVLSTPLGTLSLEVVARLPGGSQVTLELVPGALPKTPTTMATARSLAHAWPALEEALSVLADASAVTAQATPQGVPQPGTRLTSGMLFFMAALSGGNLGRWLGVDALQTLRTSGRDTLIGRLSRDLTRMGRMADGTGGPGSTAGDWRLLPIPLWYEDHVHQLRLFLRQHENRRSKKRDPREPTRFILELEMSRLGEMQFDGLIRDKRFDLMMRTRGALPKDMRQDIRQIFEDANQAAGYSGNLGFQASVDWHFLPIDQDAATGEPAGLFV